MSDYTFSQDDHQESKGVIHRRRRPVIPEIGDPPKERVKDISEDSVSPREGGGDIQGPEVKWIEKLVYLPVTSWRWVCSSLRGSGEGFLVVFKSANEALLAPGKIAMVTIGKAVMEHYNIDMIIMQ